MTGPRARAGFTAAGSGSAPFESAHTALVAAPKRKLIQTIFQDASGRPLPNTMPAGYKTASLRFRILKGSVANRPLADSRFLPREAHRERCWLAYAEALNSDNESSANDLGTFQSEFRDFFDARRTPGIDLATFAGRWGLRPEDVAASLRLSEFRWQQTKKLAGFEPPQRLPLVPLDVWRTVVGEVKVEYDPTEMTRSQAQKALEEELHEVKRSFSAAFEQIEAVATGRGLRRIPPHHRSWEGLVRIARRRVRRKKGWSWNEIAAADHVITRVAQDTVRRFEEILNS